MNKDNVVNFPGHESEPEEHVCDSCASYAIHELTHQFEEIDDEFVVSECLDRIFEAIDDEDEEAIVEFVYKMFWKAFDQGYKQHIKNQIHVLSGKLHMLSNEASGEEQ